MKRSVLPATFLILFLLSGSTLRALSGHTVSGGPLGETTVSIEAVSGGRVEGYCWYCQWRFILTWFVIGCCSFNPQLEGLIYCPYSVVEGYHLGQKGTSCEIFTPPEGGTPYCIMGEECTYPEAPEPAPLLVAVDASRPRLSSLEHGVLFDLRGQGNVRLVAWPEGARSGWLVWDRNGNGRVDGALELFSEVSRMASGSRAQDAYEALSRVDRNRDGNVDVTDPSWKELAVWIDTNRNGVSDTGELKTLDVLGIRSLSVRPLLDGHRDAAGNLYPLRASIHTKAGARLWSYIALPAQRALRGVMDATSSTCVETSR